MNHNNLFNEFYSYIQECNIEDLDLQAIAPNIMQIQYARNYPDESFVEYRDTTYIINFTNENLIEVDKSESVTIVDDDENSNDEKFTFEYFEDLKEYFNQELS